jgi:hypothetical protein
VCLALDDRSIMLAETDDFSPSGANMKLDIGTGHPRVLSKGRLRIPVFIDFDDTPVESMHITVVIDDQGDQAANTAAAITRAKALARQLGA